MPSSFRISLAGTVLALCGAAALCQDRGSPRADVPEKLRPVTRQELATVVPNCFAVSYTPAVWLRVDDEHWIERYRDGTESRYKIIGRTVAQGKRGTVAAKIGGDVGKTGNGNDG